MILSQQGQEKYPLVAYKETTAMKILSSHSIQTMTSSRTQVETFGEATNSHTNHDFLNPMQNTILMVNNKLREKENINL